MKELHLDKDKKSQMFKKILIKGIFSFVYILFLVIIGTINREKISKLSIINPITYLVCGIIILILYFGSIFFSTYLLKSKDELLGEKGTYSYYSASDLISFVFNILYSLFFVLVFFITPTTVSGSSMNNTLYDADKLLIWHLNYKVAQNDIVIVDINSNYDSYQKEEEFYIKRVVATENMNVKFVNSIGTAGVLYVNDVLVEDNISYDKFKTLMYSFSENKNYLTTEYEGVVPSGYSIVLGDNRDHSKDSRYIGLIHNSDILGKAVFRYYSKVAKFGTIEDYIL